MPPLERLRAAAFDSADDALSIVDLDGKVLAWNEGATRMFGYLSSEVVGKAAPKAYPDGRPREQEVAISQLKAGATSVKLELDRQHRDGRALRVAVTFSPIHHEGELVAVLQSARDVTERHRLMEELRRSRESLALLANIVESSHDAVFSRDPDGRILTWNRAAERLYGYTAQEILGQKWTALVAPERLPVVLERAAGVSVSRPLIDAPNVNVRKDGTRIHVAITVSPIPGPDGKEAGASVIARDLSERKRAEETQRQLEAELQSKNDQLQAAQKLEAIGSLAGGVAHDFNNLLTVILSSCTLALRKLPPADPLHHELLQIETAGERAASLTQQLLAFSRRQVLQPVVLDLSRVVNELEPMLRRLIGENLELELRAPNGLPPVRADRGQLGQVLVNLVVNARDAMPRGGRLTIEVRSVELDEAFAAGHLGVAPGPHLLLSVRDTGMGMDTTTLSRIFEPFFTTKGDRGTGLGLATVFGIVQQSGGTIWVQSEPGKGTSFDIYLPRADERATTPAASAKVSKLSGEETVLLVEDDSAVRDAVRRMLEAEGYRVLVAAGPGDALVVSEQHGARIHLMLTDVVMPRMSGKQLAARLSQTRPEMRVLYMSGYTDAEIVHEGVLEAGVEFIGKPVRREALLMKLRSVLDG
ncbi:MAG: PAS domain S-box protein [Myxococcaceae bacterium]